MTVGCADDDADGSAEPTAQEVKAQVEEEAGANIAADKQFMKKQAAGLLEQLDKEDEAQQAAQEADEKAAGDYSIGSEEGLIECLKAFMNTEAFLTHADPLHQCKLSVVCEYVAMLCGISGVDVKPWVKQHKEAMGKKFLELLAGPPVITSTSLQGAQSEKGEDDDVVTEYTPEEGEEKQLP